MSEIKKLLKIKFYSFHILLCPVRFVEVFPSFVRFKEGLILQFDCNLICSQKKCPLLRDGGYIGCPEDKGFVVLF